MRIPKNFQGINHLGKSSIIKSLYYTLGADVYFSKPWKDINFFSYINFDIDNNHLLISRYNNSFCLYKDENLYKRFESISELSEGLSSLYNIRIELVSKDEQGTIILAPPAFYYMPFYIDQENGWAANSYSFDHMTQFDLPQRKDVYMFQLGVLESTFTSFQKQKKAAERKLDTLRTEIDKLTSVVDTLSMGLDETQMSFDVNSLESAIEKRKREQVKILEDIQKIRKEIVMTENTVAQLENEKGILTKYIKQKYVPETEERQELIECPRCGNVFERSLIEKLEKTYLLDSLNEDYGKIVCELHRLETLLSRRKQKFMQLQNKLEVFDKQLASQNDAYQAYIKYKATHELLAEYKAKIGAYQVDFARAAELLKSAQTNLTTYFDSRKEAIQRYNEYFDKLLLALSVPKNQVEAGQEPGTAISASGAYGPRSKIAQILAFVMAQRDLANDIIKFPIIIDSPNALEQDAHHLAAVMKLLLSWNETSNQIINSSINGRDIAFKTNNINIIDLKNEENHVLEAIEYKNNENEIIRYFMNH